MFGKAYNKKFLKQVCVVASKCQVIYDTVLTSPNRQLSTVYEKRQSETFSMTV